MASIMYSYVIDSIKYFCSKSTNVHLRHDPNSPSLHNERCKRKSVMEVLEEHEDFRKFLPRETVPKLDTQIDERSVTSGERNLVMVLDISGSMDGKPMATMQFGVSELIKDYVENNSSLAIAYFESSVGTVVPMTLIDSPETREDISREVNALRSRGMTALSDGVIRGLELADCELNIDRNSVGNITCPAPVEMILLTDGGENCGRARLSNLIPALPDSVNLTIHVVVFGQGADRRVTELQKLTGGKTVYADTTDPLETLSRMVDLLKQNLDDKHKPIEILSEKLRYSTKAESRKVITFDGDVTTNVTLIFTYHERANVELTLTGPQGQFVNSSDTENYKVMRDRFQNIIKIKVRGIVPKVKSEWTLTIQPEITSTTPRSGTYRPIAVKDIEDPEHRGQPETPVEVFSDTAVGGIIILGKTETSKLNTTVINLVGQLSKTQVNSRVSGELAVYAMLVRDQRTLIEAGLQARAIVEYVGRVVQTIVLKDDGIGADTFAGDGIFSGAINPSALRISGYYSVNGILENSETGLRRTGQLGVLQVLQSQTPAPPARVTNLEADTNEKLMNVKLSWTSVGEELYTGTASSYEIRFSNKMNFIFSSGYNLPSELYRRLTPREAGVSQEFIFTADEAGLNRAGTLGTTVFCFKIVAKAMNRTSGEPSNVAATMFGNPNNMDEMYDPDNTTTTQEPSTQEPSTLEPSTQEPSTQKPSTQEPSTQEPSTQAWTSTVKTTGSGTSTLMSTAQQPRHSTTQSHVSEAPPWRIIIYLPQFIALVVGGAAALIILIVLLTVIINFKSSSVKNNKVKPVKPHNDRHQEHSV